MKILLTGVTGYIAQRLLPVLLENGHEVICCVRDKNRFNRKNYSDSNLTVIESDFLNESSLQEIPNDIDVAYYLIHSMSTQSGDFENMEELCASNFKNRIEQTNARQVIYLSGIDNAEELSKHLSSRKNVETILSGSKFALTTLKAGIIVGSGSASFEIIRDLVEKLPFMVTPRWLKTRCQPIAIRNVVEFLERVIGRSETYNKSYDIGGPDILSYKEMLLRFAKVRGLKRRILIVPVMTPKISSYWLYFVTATSYALAKNLVNSMKVEVICKPNNLAEMLGIKLIDFDTSIKLAFDKIEQNQVLSSWKDAQTSDIFREGFSKLIEVPVNGCFIDIRTIKVKNSAASLEKIWSIGGKNGWYYGNWLWEIRGVLDQIAGGVGMRRGRKSDTEIVSGDTLDFWRVLLADKDEKRLLLYAEMKLPGEAWLEFKIDENDILTQTATFRPLGVLGRLYWYAVLPFHGFIFNGMINKIAG
ncbi:MAG: epimerase [Sphingobacteriales bacterium 17-39-43]|uniref:SDR family oxidoreductase n=1 Tax=Daejeonella sp. TaxID=2805397 RepID=UPI000BCC8BB0|nr:SDR family oxidoreductase [Daejeonella sp.]OYZ33469.1 MAG: epimerase [Sphingobacteriales bacterium 16-39-50]OZA24512.1 MAG: epimerase [Sphingobacteriales bacterium 17-39-43]HQT24228.1 SDR family oxidoreductase [Daejeonella sp.]HQT56671.1 SDR family oxidoreductase [Daejeonella sp.]